MAREPCGTSIAMPTILITGFGPFPGAPFNPTIDLVERLAQLKRPALANVKIVSHIFETSYAAVDRDLPALLERHRPDALLMFGLAAATKYVRIETRAQNALTVLPDATGAVLRRSAIAEGAPPARKMPAPQRRLLAAARDAGVPARLSRDAGRYLCNYLCWRATEAGGPTLAAFVHVPLVRYLPDIGKKELDSRLRGNDGRWTAHKLRRVGTRVLLAMAKAIEQ